MPPIEARRLPKPARRWLTPLIALALCIGLYLTRHSLLVAAGHWLDVGSEPTHVDYIVPMPGDSNTRPFVAAAWVRAGLAKQAWLVHSHGDRPLPLNLYGAGDSAISEMVLRKRGLADDQILRLHGKTLSTADDAKLIADRLREEPNATLAVITSDYHTRRTRWTLAQAFGDLSNRVIVVSAKNEWFGPDDWWHSRRGMVAYLSEYSKLAAYWVAYGWGKWLLLAAMVVVVFVIIWRCRRSRRRALET